MGMFDSVYILDKETADLVQCAAGHRQQNVELQTKNLESRLEYYYIHLHKLYLHSNEKEPKTIENIQYDKLILLSKEFADFCSYISQSIIIYGSCHYCKPVLTYDTVSVGSGNFQILERFPFNKWELHFEDGILENVTNILTESREDIRSSKYDSRWSDKILNDEDAISKRHIELLYEKNVIKEYEK